MATGGYDLDFVSDPSEECECPICLLVLKDPQMVSCCGRKYCKTCIDRVNATNKPCPFCKEPFDCMAEKQLNRRILDLKVRCAHTKSGCGWIGEIRNVENHHSVTCLYAEVDCTLGCGECMQRLHLEQHVLDECTKRPMESKLLRLTQKLEAKLQTLEEKCEKQEMKIAQLEKEVCVLKESNEKQECEITSLNKLVEEMGHGQHTNLVQNLRAIEGELIRRCFCFSLSLNLENSSWVSPTFLSHQNGYVLQLGACIIKYRSVFRNFFRNVLHAGSRPDRYPISLYLNVLPQQAHEGKLDWPVYVTVDILVLSNTDLEANAKLTTITCFKGSPSDELCNPEDNEDDDDSEFKSMIGHAIHSFTCRLVIIKIEFGPEPPPVVQQESAVPLF